MKKGLTRAQRKMLNFLGKRLTGARISIDKHKQRSLVIAEAVDKRFGKHVYQYQQKHYRWFLIEFAKNYSDSTQYNYKLTMLKLLSFSGKVFDKNYFE
jgi:hypothetical protein